MAADPLARKEAQTENARRVPRQERAARTVDALLEAAGEAFAERGFDVATMTQIAQQAGVSVGAAYQYFPNKEALAFALRKRYGDEMDARWSALLAAHDDPARLPLPQLVERLFDLMVDLMHDYPAYLPLLSVPLGFKRDAAVRNLLRQRFTAVFLRYQPALSSDEAYRVAEVMLQVIKSLNPLYAAAKPKERKLLVAEYKGVLAAWLAVRLA
ncbi:TetR/AcrR family transcriptional regulator [Paraburkholderia unamae]|uniref:TetR family transcriptional regulator n=1 Tax=Paraburkholderia unamae TaxID=219649 RepID=A0ABX5KI00_9BURK|nr:TetR/AcrR family transcriptional regulator [Paraburkholderia unamae]PVX77820.1 TetR family transcriptional regulator [Paraburkholderia unamae]RAR58745.1 TetR family transcriptional regulator [Paraburkholderia unamae]CAG9256468.1 Transcriptional regulator, TetR family [Paraburkholderia unamae]